MQRLDYCLDGSADFPYGSRLADASALTVRITLVKRVLVLVGTTLGSSLGWWLGSPGGLFGSFIVSMIGFGVGMYCGAQFARRLDG